MSAAPTTILVIEDEPAIAAQIVRRLQAEGWRTLAAADGNTGLSLASSSDLAAVVLDVMLPGLDGIEVCRRIHINAAASGTVPPPILMLTARDDEGDMLLGLGVGADDYMTKPFSMRELVARLRVLMRRFERASQQSEQLKAGQPEPPLVLGNLTIDQAGRRVWRGEEEAHLTPTEFDLLAALAASPGTVHSRDRLLAQVWDWIDASGTRTVDSHIKALRRKLGSDLIRTVHGVGYALEVPADDDSHQ